MPYAADGRRFEDAGSRADQAAVVAVRPRSFMPTRSARPWPRRIGTGLRIGALHEHVDTDFGPRRDVEDDGRLSLRVSGERLPVLFTLLASRAQGSPQPADDQGVRKSLLLAAGTALVLLFFAAAVTAESGLDYVIDSGGPIDALVRGDWNEFFANQPLMGSFSLFVRAPFVWPVFHSSLPTVYWAGALPCILALLGLAVWLLREMQRRGRATRSRRWSGRR
jgi:hypothetical protein